MSEAAKLALMRATPLLRGNFDYHAVKAYLGKLHVTGSRQTCSALHKLGLVDPVPIGSQHLIYLLTDKGQRQRKGLLGRSAS